MFATTASGKDFQSMESMQRSCVLVCFTSLSSCRHVDLFEMEESLCLEELVLWCHVQRWWLSLVPALEWLVEIKDALKKLVIDELRINCCSRH